MSEYNYSVYHVKDVVAFLKNLVILDMLFERLASDATCDSVCSSFFLY